MFKFIRLSCFLAIFYSCNSLYSAIVNHTDYDLNKMSCSDLMIDMILGSSLNKTFKDFDLAFGFERINDNHIMIKVVRKVENHRNGVYANLDLNLAESTLNNIDREQPIPIKINKHYIPFIATKCTPDEDLYVNTGKLPDEND